MIHVFMMIRQFLHTLSRTIFGVCYLKVAQTYAKLADHLVAPQGKMKMSPGYQFEGVNEFSQDSGISNLFLCIVTNFSNFFYVTFNFLCSNQIKDFL